jgi:hypothetical protein
LLIEKYSEFSKECATRLLKLVVIVDSLVEDYNAEDQESEKCKLAHRIVSNIMSTYYPEIDIKKADKDSMLKNVQQRAGIIVNMFRDKLSQSINYSESNLVEMAEKEAEEEPKN